MEIRQRLIYESIVTGGAGYIGSHTVRALIESNHHPVILDNLVYGNKSIVDKTLRVPLIVGQVGNKKILKEIIEGSHTNLKGTIHEGKIIEAVMHFAAYEHEESVKDPLKYYINNVIESTILLDFLRRKYL